MTNTGNLPRSELFLNKKFWEELIACFPLIQQGSHRKRTNPVEEIDRQMDRHRDRERTR
jgi:hypothetical protein